MPPRSSARPRRCGRRRWSSSSGRPRRWTRRRRGRARSRPGSPSSRRPRPRSPTSSTPPWATSTASSRSCRQEQVDVNDRTAANWKAYVDQLTAAGRRAAGRGSCRTRRPGCPRAGPGGRRERGSAAGRRPAPAPAHVAAGPPGRDPRRGHRGDGRPGAALRARDGRPRVVGLRLAGAVGVRRARASPCRRPRRTCSPSRRRSRAADVLPGDLVFLGNSEAGLGHVGIALDPQTMLAADARAGAVVVRTLPADQVLGIGRPSLGQRAPVAAPGPDRRRPADGVRQHRLPAELRRGPAVGRLPERADPAQRHVPAGRGRARPALRRGRGLPGDVGGLRDGVRLADLHHRLLSHLRQPGAALRARSRPSPPFPAPATTAGGWPSTSAGGSRTTARRRTPG